MSAFQPDAFQCDAFQAADLNLSNFVVTSTFREHTRTMDTPISAKAALLQALLTGDGYGLDLIERVRARTRNTVLLNQGSVYPALRSLEKEGLVKCCKSEPSPKHRGRPRHYYRLTALGNRSAHSQGKALASFFLIELVNHSEQ